MIWVVNLQILKPGPMRNRLERAVACVESNSKWQRVAKDWQWDFGQIMWIASCGGGENRDPIVAGSVGFDTVWKCEASAGSRQKGKGNSEDWPTTNCKLGWHERRPPGNSWMAVSQQPSTETTVPCLTIASPDFVAGQTRGGLKGGEKEIVMSCSCQWGKAHMRAVYF